MSSWVDVFSSVIWDSSSGLYMNMPIDESGDTFIEWSGLHGGTLVRCSDVSIENIRIRFNHGIIDYLSMSLPMTVADEIISWMGRNASRLGEIYLVSCIGDEPDFTDVELLYVR